MLYQVPSSRISTEQESAVWNPFSPAYNPHCGQAVQGIRDWMHRSAAFSSQRAQAVVERSQFIDLMAMAYPHAMPAALTVIACWGMWIFALDDLCDHTALGTDPNAICALHRDISAALHGTLPAVPSPLIADIHSIGQQLRRVASPEWHRRFARRMANYGQGCIWEAHNRATGQTPDARTYLRLRPFSGAMTCALSLVELSTGYSLDDATRALPAMRRLERLGMLIVCVANDLSSYVREVQAGETHNLVAITMRETGQTIDRAAQVATDLHNDMMTSFLHTAAELPRHKAVRAYTEGMQAFIRANHDWSSITARYAGGA